MSFCRNVTPEFSFGLFKRLDESNKSPSSRAQHNVGWRYQLGHLPFLMLTFFQHVLASQETTIYSKESSSDTHYSIGFDPTIFPDLRAYLMKYCGAIISETSSLIYNTSTSPHCMKDEIEGPDIQLSIEMGKNLTASLQSCLNEVMLMSCKNYYNERTPGDSKEVALIALAVFGTLFCLMIIAAAITGCQQSNRYDNGYQQSNRSDIDIGAGLALLFASNASTHNDHADHSDRVSVSWR